jgi:hypothetical protein
VSRAADRMNAGRVQGRRGTRTGSTSRQTWDLRNLGNTRRTALLKWMDRQPQGQRRAVLAELDGRKDPQAAALAAELRERWGTEDQET